MELSPLRQVYAWEGPFATVYTEGRSPGEDAAEQTRLRWKAQRERLQKQGASEAAVEQIESLLMQATAGEAQVDGRVLVANESDVVLDAQWDAALGSGDAAHWTELPELGAYVRERVRSVRELVVIADQEGADVFQEVIAKQHEPREMGSEEVEGSASTGVHKPRGGALAHNQIQRHADENVARNAKDIVSHVSAVAERFEPRVLVLAGEVQARTAIREHLPPHLAENVIETDRGGRDRGASDESLTEELMRIAQDETERSMQHHAQRLESGLAHGQAAQGNESVARGAEMGAMETLLLEDEVEASREAFLLKTCAETGSSAMLVPYGTGLSDGVGALLRYPIDG